ncbi:MAG: PQQ-binding-like beta-propeller repeat protein, partial [Planctomycetaceae bacterium]|nr:PQQ-binding-like beta-propeller repeat protein [Planctomycetaceae bacterium]
RTGETTKTFTLKGEESGARWGGLAVSGDVLVVTADPVSVQDVDAKKVDDLLEPTRYSTSSTQLVAFDRNTGSELWRRHAAFSFRHNAVCLSDDTVYCIDGMSPQALDVLKRRGISTSSVPQLLALDLHSGNIRWSTEENVFGTFLNYSAEHDLLIQAGSAARDRAKDDVGEGMIAYRGVDGEVLWERLDLKYNGPCLLLRDRIITNGAGGFALNLLTGEETGWGYTRMYGCNTAVGCQTMLTFRSGAAGFFDLAGDSGTGNLGGFRSSCTSNLIPADGVLNAPDYTRTCVCAYQLQTSLAFVHMEDADMWTFNPEQAVSTPLKSVGLNLGAPGDRRDADGVMWFEYPATGGPSPDLHVGTKPESPEWFLQNSLLSQDQQIGWITSSGTTDLTELEWDLEDLVEPGTYTVRLIFAVHSDPPAEAKSITFSLKG